jgi:hypothetical protein
MSDEATDARPEAPAQTSKEAAPAESPMLIRLRARLAELQAQPLEERQRRADELFKRAKPLPLETQLTLRPKRPDRSE